MKIRSVLSVAALAALLLVRPAVAGLPTTPSTTYVANSPPPIKAQDLNDLQKYLAGIYSAVYSVKALVVDGTGGVATTGAPGTVRVSSAVSAYSTVAPFSMPVVPVGELNREQILLGAVRCQINSGTGAITSCGGFNVGSVVRTSPGSYFVQFNNAFPDINRHVPVVSPLIIGGSRVFGMANGDAITAGQYGVALIFYNNANAPTDPDGFRLIVVGG